MMREVRRHMKRYGAALLLAAVLLAGLGGCASKDEGVSGLSGGGTTGGGEGAALYYDADREVSYGYRCGERYIEVYDGAEFRPVYLNGVNIGSGVPGHFPGELAATREDYLRWFGEIGEMHANVIRVYTTMMPCFYEALKTYNQGAAQPLYLVMGVWYDEAVIVAGADAYDVLEGAVAEAQEQIDIIHGNAVIAERAGKAYGTYAADVSPWALGWILGIEPDAALVGGTNERHPELDSYAGTYLTTEGSDAFHVFLCELGERVIEYETVHYGVQRPISWADWPTADVMDHPAEPSPEKEDAVVVDVERIHPTEAFRPGVFASYHVYPYYPDFMYLEEGYVSFVDENGNPNTYEAYLRDLISHHTVPVVVAEFGVPSSRGVTHVNPVTGLDQGHLNETQQGWCLDAMARDIHRTGYAGGFVFSWQDEWFKRTWNTMDYTDPERRAYWSDAQTSEQRFGLLAFDAGEEDVVLIDGQDDDWGEGDVLFTEDGLTLSVKDDEAYLYLMVRGYAPGTEEIVIPVDVTPLSGATHYGDRSFEGGADFLIDLLGEEDSRVLVQGYYDRYAFFYRNYDNLLDQADYGGPEDADFHPIYLSLNKALTDPLTGEMMDAQRYETGLLRYGNADPESDAFDSLADFCYGEEFVELRIPWGMLNFRDPSSKEVEWDFREKGELGSMTVSSIGLGLTRPGKSTFMAPYVWEGWTQPKSHERLKASYYIMRDCFDGLGVE